VWANSHRPSVRWYLIALVPDVTKAFEGKPLVGFAVAFGGVLLVGGVIELARRVIAWQRRRAAAGAGGGEPGA
jgi:hypothetical protein